MHHHKLGFFKKMAKVCEKDLTFWIRTRRFCAGLYYSDVRLFLEVLMVIAYLVLSSQVDFVQLKPRPTSWIPMSDTFFREFIYAQAGFFSMILLLGTIANCGPKDISGFLTDPNVILDVVLVVKDLADMQAMNSLNGLRIFRLITLIMKWHKMDHLREVVNILKRSLIVAVSIIGVLLFCYLFLGMVLNNLIVR